MERIAALTQTFSRPFPKPSPEALARAAENERREREEEARRFAESSRVPERYLSATLADCDPRVRGWAEDPAGRNLVLTGPAGSGKTHQACAALLAQRGRGRVLFATGASLLRDIRSCYGSADSESDVVSRYSSVPFLVVDDLGKERPTAWALEMLYEVVNGRYNRMRPTVYTTQYGSKALGARLMSEGGDQEVADAILRRISEGAVSVRLSR